MPKSSIGMKPGEYMRTSLVPVYDPNSLEGTMTIDGIERRPEFFIPVVRRLDTTWRIEVLRGVPIEDGVIPHEVVTRITELQKRIMREQRSDRGRDAALVRRAQDQEDAEGQEDLDDAVPDELLLSSREAG